MKDLSNENIIHVKKNDMEYIQFRRLLEYKNLVHCYTLSANNFDVAGNDTMEDKKKTVIDNYNKLANALQIDVNSIIRPYQTHTTNVEEVKNVPQKIDIFENYKDIDGLITNLNNVALSLGYADCTPIFLYDYNKDVIGNTHSGWKGTLGCIAKCAIEKMKNVYNSNPQDIIACIGPCIKKCHFEVKDDVYEMFFNKFNYTKRICDIIEKTSNGTYKIDTTLINKLLLLEAGLKEENIIDSNICTACNCDIMHSYRMRGDSAGRNTAIISYRSQEAIV